MEMHNPAHPGRYLKEMYLEPLGISITAAAERLKVTRQTISELVNERAGVSPEMAIRLAEAFSTSPDVWLSMQKNRDLWLARQKFKPKIKPFWDGEKSVAE